MNGTMEAGEGGRHLNRESEIDDPLKGAMNLGFVALHWTDYV